MLGKCVWGDKKTGRCQLCEIDPARHKYNTKEGFAHLCDACYERETGLQKIERLNEIS